MSKFVKYEFKAIGRMMLPLLIVCCASALMEAVSTRVTGIPDILQVIVSMVFVLSLLAIGFLILIVVISRFYRNTMTDDAYLTMTLPINEHEIIWGEIVATLLWVILAGAALFVIALITMQIAGFIDISQMEMGRVLKEINEMFREAEVSWFGIASIIIQVILMMLLAFTAWCLHFYASMAVGQLFNKHRGLMSVIAWFLIRVALVALFTGGMYLLSQITGESLTFYPETAAQITDVANLALGMLNIAIAIEAAVLYVPTFLLIGKKINLV